MLFDKLQYVWQIVIKSKINRKKVHFYNSNFTIEGYR